MIDIINTILTFVPEISKYKKYRDVVLNNNFKIRIFGTLETCTKVIIIGHGVGGTKDSFYVKSLVNRFAGSPEVAVITLDGPGIKDNINADYMCSPSVLKQNAYIDDIIEYIKFINNDCKLYTAGFSAAALFIFSYLTCSQNIIKNNNKDKIRHSFLISMPSLEYDDQMSWIEKKSKLKPFISAAYSFSTASYALKKRDMNTFIKTLKHPFNIKKSLHHVENGIWYKHENNNPSKINATFFYSKKDPVVGYHLDNDKNIILKHHGYNVLEFYGGGHCSFRRLDGKKSHEEIIFSHIMNDEN